MSLLADNRRREYRIDRCRRKTLVYVVSYAMRDGRLGSAPFPLTVIAGKVDALGARTPAKALVAPRARAKGATVPRPFIVFYVDLMIVLSMG